MHRQRRSLLACEQGGATANIEGPLLDTSQQKALHASIAAGAKAVIDAEAKLTAWDEVSGDGDCGMTLAAGAKAVLEDLPGYPLSSAAGLVRALSFSIERSMGGATTPSRTLAVECFQGTRTDHRSPITGSCACLCM